MENRLFEVLQQVVGFLQRQGIPFVIVGGLANIVWGEPRVTRDVDVKVYIGERTPRQFAEMVTREFAPAQLLPGGPDLIVSIAFPSGVNVDFLIAIPGYEEIVLERAQRRHLAGLDLPICSAEDLIIYKVIADRPKDWADIEGILTEQGNRLDQAYIRDWLRQFAEVLERPDWLERYDALVRRIVGEP